MESEEHLRALDDAGAAVSHLMDAAPAGAPVPTCPGWDVEKLVRHLGKVHRWAATIVETPVPEPLGFRGFDAGDPGSASQLGPWFRDGHARLVRALREAPPDLRCWGFLPAPTPRAFWCRRQAHESVVHLVDLALAAGLPAGSPGWEAPPAFAVDGIDELLRGWLRGRLPEPDEEEGPSLRVVATDAPLDWQVGLPDRHGLTLVRGPEATRAATCTVRGRALDLYLLLWNRRSAQGLQVDGDVTVLDGWAATRQV